MPGFLFYFDGAGIAAWSQFIDSANLKTARLNVPAYPDLMLVITPMKSQGNDGSFGRLFRYISGANDDERKVAMTTPVFMEPEKQDRDGQMGFVVPAKVAAGHIPDPVDEAVRLQKRNGGRFAVIRFSGRLDADSIAENEAKLQTWIGSKAFRGTDAVEFAGYDPPWTPNPLRRNEILIRLRVCRRRGDHPSHKVSQKRQKPNSGSY